MTLERSAAVAPICANTLCSNEEAQRNTNTHKHTISGVQVLSHGLTCIFDGNSSMSACAPGSGSSVCRVQSSVKVHMALWCCTTSLPDLCVCVLDNSCHVTGNCWVATTMVKLSSATKFIHANVQKKKSNNTLHDQVKQKHRHLFFLIKYKQKFK